MKIRCKDYAEFNDALDRLMTTDNKDDIYNDIDTQNEMLIKTNSYYKTATDDLTNKCKCAKGTGTITVNVSVAFGAVPVEGAKVSVYNSDNTFVDEDISNDSGKTKKFYLSTPPTEYSVDAKPLGENVPYALYNIKVEKAGYYTQEFLNVAVFPGIESIQKVSMEPLDADSYERDRILINESKTAVNNREV